METTYTRGMRPTPVALLSLHTAVMLIAAGVWCSTSALGQAPGDPGDPGDRGDPPDRTDELAAAEPDPRPALAEAPRVERQTLEKLLKPGAWPRRAIAAMRLERYGCGETRAMLEKLVNDDAWQVRAFAVRSLARRREPAGENWFVAEDEPRVVRAVLRHRYPLDAERIGRGVRALVRASSFDLRMLGVELAAASGDAELVDTGRETLKTIILRMERDEGGRLSPRIAAVTGAADQRKHYRWKRWLMTDGRRFVLQPAFALADAPEESPPLGPLAELSPRDFAALETYIEQLSERRVDLAICIDCTGSMWDELADAQAGIDDMMLFIGDVVESLRVGLVAYRDRREEFETKGWDFTADIGEARSRLWTLNAHGGGDKPESVFKALRMAYTKLTWHPGRTNVLILVGDGPPHVGLGGQCVELARRGRTIDLTTHVVQADDKDVKHFPQIAEAGGGRCVSLTRGDSLTAEIAGLTLGDRFDDELREFFNVYLELCR